MRIDNPSAAVRAKIFTKIDARRHSTGQPTVKYLDFGVKTVRLISHSDLFSHHVERQLDFILKDDAPSYDCTLIIWQDKNIAQIALTLLHCHDAQAFRNFREKKIDNQAFIPKDMYFFDNTIYYEKPFIQACIKNDIFTAFNPDTNTHYYSVSSLAPEEFIKKGHIFVPTFNKILKSPTTNLAHGAVVGLNSTGALICGVGHRGKSTFAVSALMQGFDYVTDDYFTIEKKDNAVLSWPIYSIITLAPTVYQAMYAKLDAKFISNNARKDKYVFNISSYHSQFKQGYPIKLCLFPRFTKDAEPSIEPGDKDVAIQEFILSTLRQMGEAEDVKTIAKKYDFIKDLPFYRINLTKDFCKNTQCLRKFLHDFPPKGI